MFVFVYAYAFFVSLVSNHFGFSVLVLPPLQRQLVTSGVPNMRVKRYSFDLEESDVQMM